jgi:hypothetical protein
MRSRLSAPEYDSSHCPASETTQASVSSHRIADYITDDECDRSARWSRGGWCPIQRICRPKIGRWRRAKRSPHDANEFRAARTDRRTARTNCARLERTAARRERIAHGAKRVSHGAKRIAQRAHQPERLSAERAVALWLLRCAVLVRTRATTSLRSRRSGPTSGRGSSGRQRTWRGGTCRTGLTGRHRGGRARPRVVNQFRIVRR